MKTICFAFSVDFPVFNSRFTATFRYNSVTGSVQIFRHCGHLMRPLPSYCIFSRHHEQLVCPQVRMRGSWNRSAQMEQVNGNFNEAIRSTFQLEKAPVQEEQKKRRKIFKEITLNLRFSMVLVLTLKIVKNFSIKFAISKNALILS